MVYAAFGLYTSGADCVQSPPCLPNNSYWNDPKFVPHTVISRVLFSKHPTPPSVVDWRTYSGDSLSAAGHRRVLEHGPGVTVWFEVDFNEFGGYIDLVIETRSNNNDITWEIKGTKERKLNEVNNA